MGYKDVLPLRGSLALITFLRLFDALTFAEQQELI